MATRDLVTSRHRRARSRRRHRLPPPPATSWVPPCEDVPVSERLQPGAPVIMINDTSRWPVVRISDQHVFQPGAQGGLEPDAYLRQPRTPVPDDTAPEAEWGAEPGLTAAVAAWCAEHGHPMITITFHGPQAPSAAVAATFRTWYRDRGENDRRLIVPSFILTDPWLTITRAAVPFWTFFSVQSALDSLDQVPARHRIHGSLRHALGQAVPRAPDLVAASCRPGARTAASGQVVRLLTGVRRRDGHPGR